MKKPSCRIAGDAFAHGAAVYGLIREEAAQLREAFLPIGERPDAQGRDRASRGLSSRRCPVHAQYPLLVAGAYPFMERDKLLELCRLGRLYAEHLLAFDRVLDRGERANPLDLLISSLQQAESLLALYRWFSPGHPFWEDFWERAARTWRAVLLERIRHGHCLAPYPWEEYETIATDKGALLTIFALAPTYVSGDGDLRQRLSNALDEHHKGLVLLDDLQDWREDYTRGQYSYPLTRVLLDNGLDDLVRTGPRPPLATVGRLLYGTGVAEEQLSLAEVCFQRAVEGLVPLALPDWTALNWRYGSLCASLRARVGRYQTEQGRRRTDSEAGRLEGYDRKEETGREGRPAVLIQEGISDISVQAARKGLQVCRHLLRKPDALCLVVGRWEGMPPHFHLVDRERIWVGVQASDSKERAEATSGRPLETETVLACVRAQRILCVGRERTLLETCFVAGLALAACLDLRSLQEPWRYLAMGSLEWQWCQKNEWVLWEMLQKHGHRERARGAAGDLADPFPVFGPPAPRGAVLYLSLRLFEEAAVNAVVANPLWLLERWKSWEIRSALGLRGGWDGDGDG